MKKVRSRTLFFILIGLVSVSFSAYAHSKPAFEYFHPEISKGKAESLLDRVKEIEKMDFENVHFEDLAANPLSSHHLVVIRKKEPLHYHAVHDGWAIVLKGQADFFLGETQLRLRPGTSVYIPRGVRHQAVNSGKDPLAAFVIFTPPYDGKDLVRVEE